MHFAVLAGESSGMTETMKSAISDSFGAVKTDVLDVISTALPVALGIVAVVLAITLGVKFFKKMAKGA